VQQFYALLLLEQLTENFPFLLKPL